MARPTRPGPGRFCWRSSASPSSSRRGLRTVHIEKAPPKNRRGFFSARFAAGVTAAAEAAVLIGLSRVSARRFLEHLSRRARRSSGQGTAPRDGPNTATVGRDDQNLRARVRMPLYRWRCIGPAGDSAAGLPGPPGFSRGKKSIVIPLRALPDGCGLGLPEIKAAKQEETEAVRNAGASIDPPTDPFEAIPLPSRPVPPGARGPKPPRCATPGRIATSSGRLARHLRFLGLRLPLQARGGIDRTAARGPAAAALADGSPARAPLFATLPP